MYMPYDIFEYIVVNRMLDVRSVAMLVCASKELRAGLLGWETAWMLSLPYSYDRCFCLRMRARGMYLDFLVDRRCRCCGSSRSNIVWDFGVRWCRDCFVLHTTTDVALAADVDVYLLYDLYDNGICRSIRCYRKKELVSSLVAGFEPATSRLTAEHSNR